LHHVLFMGIINFSLIIQITVPVIYDYASVTCDKRLFCTPFTHKPMMETDDELSGWPIRGVCIEIWRDWGRGICFAQCHLQYLRVIDSIHNIVRYFTMTTSPMNHWPSIKFTRPLFCLLPYEGNCNYSDIYIAAIVMRYLSGWYSSPFVMYKIFYLTSCMYECVSKSSRTGRLETELQNGTALCH
jgi:hypothetical protein